MEGNVQNAGVLAKLEGASRLLAEARTLDEVKKIVDLAEAATTYARAAKLGLQAQNYAAEVALRGKRKAGEIAATIPPTASAHHSNRL